MNPVNGPPGSAPPISTSNERRQEAGTTGVPFGAAEPAAVATRTARRVGTAYARATPAVAAVRAIRRRPVAGALACPGARDGSRTLSALVVDMCSFPHEGSAHWRAIAEPSAVTDRAGGSVGAFHRRPPREWRGAN